jgi:3',5'-cyclic AMP phosphodiesterase CpdA
MLIAQLSDLHITSLKTKTCGVAPMAQNLSQTIAHINSFVPKPDVVIVTGDITDSGSKYETVCAFEILEQLTIPYYVSPGNHDDRNNLRSVFRNRIIHPTQDDAINYVIEDYSVRLIVVDTSRPGFAGGEVNINTCEWLDLKLSQELNKPTLLFMHHPPAKLGVIETDIDGFLYAEKLKTIIVKYPNIKSIACGHTHSVSTTLWGNTYISTAPSIGMRLVVDLTLEEASKFTLAQPEYLLHYWNGEQLITHTISVDDGNKKKYLF